jgi:hypothetical protein
MQGDERVDYKAKVTVLDTELNCIISYFKRKHMKTKHRSNIVKISSICFSAAITVILGLNSTKNASELFSDISLILGALVTVINAIDAFYGFSSLWVKNTITLARLRELKRKVELYEAGREDKDFHEEDINKLVEELQQILKDDINQWLRIREKIESTGIPK